MRRETEGGWGKRLTLPGRHKLTRAGACYRMDERPGPPLSNSGLGHRSSPLEADMTHPQNIARPVSTSIARLRMCEGVGQGRSSLPYVPHTLAQMLARSTLPPELVVVVPQPKRRQRKPRRPTLAGVSKQASRAGIEVARYEIKPDGTVVVVTGKSEATEPNPWLDDLKVTKQ